MTGGVSFEEFGNVGNVENAIELRDGWCINWKDWKIRQYKVAVRREGIMKMKNGAN